MPSRVSRITFFLIFALTGFFFYRTVRPMLLWVGVGGFCAILTWQQFLALVRVLHGRRHLAAVLCTIGVVIAIVTPLFVIAWMVSREGIDFAQQWQQDSPNGTTIEMPHALRGPLDWLRDAVPNGAEHLKTAAESVAREGAVMLTAVLAGIPGALVGVFVWVLSLYYFYVDGHAWLDETRALLPLPERHTTAFFEEFRSVSHAVFYGYVVCAFAQGLFDGLAFWLLGIPAAVLLGALVAVLALLPVLGSIVVWVPASIWLFSQGRPVAAVVLLLVGTAVLAGVDYVLRPTLTRGQLEMHPLLVFLSIFGGLAAFGFAGAFLGPLFAALFLASVRIYATEFPPKRGGRESPPPLALEGVSPPIH